MISFSDLVPGALLSVGLVRHPMFILLLSIDEMGKSSGCWYVTFLYTDGRSSKIGRGLIGPASFRYYDRIGYCNEHTV